MIQTLTLLFLILLIAGLSLQVWLLYRHYRHVSQHRHQVPDAFAERISLADHQKAADYTLAKARLYVLELPFGAIVLLFWTLGGGINWLNQFWQGVFNDPLLAGVALLLSVPLISALFELPFSIWRTFRLEARFGFNRTTVTRFVTDLLLALGLSLLLGGLLAWAVLWLMAGAGELWWLAVWLLWSGFSLLMTWIFPTWIAPLFNRFTPLPEGELRQTVESLLNRCGFQSRGVYVMDGSSRSAHGNAYFTGFGRNKRIVFFDTLLESLNPKETEAVLAHELGHFKRRHVLKRMITMEIISLIGLALLAWLAQQAWFYSTLGVDVPSNAAALLLFLLVTPVFTIFFHPLSALLMRRHEFEADAYAVDQSDGQALVSALVKLYQDNASTLTPDPLYSAFHDSHPPAPVRIAHISAKMGRVAEA